MPSSSAQRLSRLLACMLPRAVCVLLSSLDSVPPQPGLGPAGAKFLAITDEVVSILEPSADLGSPDCCHLPALHGSTVAPGHAATCLPSSVCRPQGSLGHTWYGGDHGVSRFSTNKEMPHTGLRPLLFVPGLCIPSHGFLLPVSQHYLCFSPCLSVIPPLGSRGATAVRLQVAAKSLHLLSLSPCQGAGNRSAARAAAAICSAGLRSSDFKMCLYHRLPRIENRHEIPPCTPCSQAASRANALKKCLLAASGSHFHGLAHALCPSSS